MKRNKIFILIATMCLTGCIFFEKREPLSPPRFGPEFNDIREEIGLAPLPEDWNCYSREPYKGGLLDKWVAPNRNISPKKKPYHHVKNIAYKNDTILLESDYFYSTKEFIIFDGTLFERLLVECYFNIDNINWTYSLRTRSDEKADGFYFAKSIDLNRKQADSILISWNLPPLPPPKEK